MCILVGTYIILECTGDVIDYVLFSTSIQSSRNILALRSQTLGETMEAYILRIQCYI